MYTCLCQNEIDVSATCSADETTVPAGLASPLFCFTSQEETDTHANVAQICDQHVDKQVECNELNIFEQAKIDDMFPVLSQKVRLASSSLRR